MKLKRIWTRKKDLSHKKEKEGKEFIYDNEELKEWIKVWINHEGWNLKDFETFIKLVGVNNPVKLSKHNQKVNSFKCRTADNTEVMISLRFISAGSEIWVTEGEVTRKYIINHNYENKETVPKVTLKSRKIERNGKELESAYKKYSCCITLKIDENHLLKVNISEPNVRKVDGYDAKVTKDCQKIEEYLLGLDDSLVISQVYDNFLKLINFSEEDISNHRNISISYIETINKKEIIRSENLQPRGNGKEYVVIENDETYQVCESGDWSYLSRDTQIVYFKKHDYYNFNTKGSKQNVISVNPDEIIKRVEKRILELMDFVK